MFKTRKSLPLAAALALSLGLAQGCSEAPATVRPGAPAQTPAAATVPNEFAGVTGLSKYAVPVTLTYARNAGLDKEFKTGQSYEKNIWMTEFEEILGIKIDTLWTAEGVEAYDQKLNLSIAAQDLPDFFVCNASQFNSLVQADLLADLTDVLAEYQTPFLKESLAEDATPANGGGGLAQATRGGRLYALPSQSVAAGKQHLVFLREDWRRELNLPVPNTMDDLWKIAQGFTGNSLDGLGVPTYGLGLGNQPYETYFAYKGFFNAYGAFFNQWILKDGQVVYGTVQPEMKTALAELKKYVDAGFVDPEFSVKDAYTVSTDAIGGKNGISFAEWWLITWPLPDGVKLGQEWKAYPIPTAANGPAQRVGAEAKLLNRIVVRKGCPNPEAVVKMANLFHERIMSQKYDTRLYKNDEVYDFQGLSPVYVVVGADRNNQNYLDVSKALETRNATLLEPVNNDQRDNYQRSLKYLDGVDKDNPDLWSTYYTAYHGLSGPESVMAILHNYGLQNLMNVDPFYGADTPAISENIAQWKSDTEEFIIGVLTGAVPLDAFDQLVETWSALGGGQATAEVNAWYQQQR